MNVHSTSTVNVPGKRQTNPGELYTSVAWIRCQEPGTRKHLNRKRKQRPGPGKRNSFPNWGYGENMVMLSFNSFGGANTAFSAVSTLRFSQESVADTIIINYLLTLVGRPVLLARLDNLNNFGVYKLVSLIENVSEPAFYDAVFTLIVANGNLTADKYYGFAVYPALEDGNDLNFIYTQPTPSATWNITHDLGKFPSVSVVDSANTQVYGNVDYIDDNSLTLTFTGAFSGKAYLN
jgi:hypothetical protein